LLAKHRFLLGAFEELREATATFFMSVSVSVRPFIRIEHLTSHLKDFMGI